MILSIHITSQSCSRGNISSMKNLHILYIVPNTDLDIVGALQA